MSYRTIQEIQTAIEYFLLDTLAIPVYTRTILNTNTYEFKMFDGNYVYFTPYDSDYTISYGLFNKGYLLV